MPAKSWAADPLPPLQNHIVACSPTFSHRLPHVFKQPEQYQPDRFAPPREEDKPIPFSYLGFGGGRHGCMVRRAPGCGRPRNPSLVEPRLSQERGAINCPSPTPPTATPHARPAFGLQGQNFAYLQIKTIWSVLLRNFDFEMIDPVGIHMHIHTSHFPG